KYVFGIFTTEAEVLAIAMQYLPIAVLIFFGSSCRAPMNTLINGSGNYKINFVTAILDGIVLRIGFSVLFGLVLDMEYLGFWLGDALAGFTPFWIGLVYLLTGKWKTNKYIINKRK
ncbi:MAG: MATE family efflux transporter, partial [Firmicutes bacterium]|nr:MATE family efflux transporter [Bacillota bacterium]